jgi:hypothetical protein
MNTRICPQCGTEINASSKHCPECGSFMQPSQTIPDQPVFCINSSCRIPITPTALFCLKCGASQTTIPAPILAKRNKDISHPSSLAVVLSLIFPGAGQAYNMQMWKSLIILLAGMIWAFILYTTADYVPASIMSNTDGAMRNLVIIGLLKTWITFAFISLSLVDAGVIAARINAGKAIDEWSWF